MRRFFLIVIFIFSLKLYADFDGCSLQPTSIVAGCVNAISGEFIETCTDLVIAGSEPLAIQRAFKKEQKGELENSWHLNHQGVFAYKSHKTYITGSFFGTFGQKLKFHGPYKKHDPKAHLHLASAQIHKGLTNFTSNEVSARTNHKNEWVEYDNHFKTFTHHKGSGDSYIYKKDPDHKKAYLSKHCKPNGSNYIYRYNTSNHLNSINLLSPKHTCKGAFQILRHDHFSKHPEMTIKAKETQQWVKYHFVSYSEGSDEEFENGYFLNTVESSCGPTVAYRYGEFKKIPVYSPEYEVEKPIYVRDERHSSKRLRNQGTKTETIKPEQKIIFTILPIRKELPDGRFQEFDYYTFGDNHFPGWPPLHVPESEPFSQGKIKYIRAPVGIDGRPVITHRFYYDINRPNGVFVNAATRVYDAHNRRTSYEYDKKFRLHEIGQYRSDGHLYFQELFFWGESGPDEGNLLSRAYLIDRKAVICHNNSYDERGNVIYEKLCGNITGNNPSFISLDNNGTVVSSGHDTIEKRYTYAKNPLNLLETETQGPKTVRYFYKPNTSLITAKFTSVHGKIILREGYDYDDEGLLICETIDDGISENMGDLSGVTERKITCYSNLKTHPYGMPEWIEEKYLDLKTREVLLCKKKKNTYGWHGKPTLQEVYDSRGNYAYKITTEYDRMGNVTKEINPLGEQIERRYDANGNLIWEKGPSPKFHSEYTYDFANRCIRKDLVSADGTRFTERKTYDVLSTCTTSTDLFGNTEVYVVTELGTRIDTLHPTVEDSNGNPITIHTRVDHDPLFHPIVETDGKGNKIHYKFTIFKKPYLIEYPDGTQEAIEYNLDGEVIKAVSKDGTVVKYERDLFNRITKKETYSPQGEILNTYQAVYSTFHLLHEIDEAGIASSYEYDCMGRKIREEKGDHLITYAYDGLGRVRRVNTYYGTEDDQFTSQVTFHDFLDRLVEERIEDSQGNILKKIGYAYDEHGNQTEIITYTETGPKRITTEYNLFNKPVQITDPQGNKTVICYNFFHRNPLGQNVLAVETTDPQGIRTEEIYDAMQRVVKKIKKDTLGKVIQSRDLYYDQVGNLTRTVDEVISSRESRKITNLFEYDSMKRLTKCTEAAGASEEKITMTTYDRFGRKEAIIKPDGTAIIHSYDERSRLKHITSSEGTIDYAYEYDQNDMPVAIFDHVNNTLLKRAYDQEKRLIKEILDNGLSIHYEYDKQNRVVRLNLPDQSNIFYQYDAAYLRTVEKRDAEGKTQFQHFYTQFDLNGNLLEMISIDKRAVNYKYDEVGKLIKIETKGFIENLSYDKVGNLIQKKIEEEASQDIHCNYSYDPLYQLTKEDGIISHNYENDSCFNRISTDFQDNTLNDLHQLLETGSKRYEYDINGNLVREISETETIAYTYDAQDRLTAVTKADERFRYQYDVFNRRVSRFKELLQEGEWNVVNTIHYLYELQNEVGVADQEHKIVQLRILGIGKGAEIGSAVAIQLEHNTYAPQHDHQGNVANLYNLEGELIEKYRYGAYGEEKIYHRGIQQNGSVEGNPWRFSSKRKDEETGNIYFGRRYYNPETGRWITADPLGHSAGINLYAYVSNNPLTHFDLYGLLDEKGVYRDWDLWDRVRDAKEYVKNIVRTAASAIKNIFKNISEGINFVRKKTGKTIKTLARETIPIPILKDVFSLAGHMLAGENFSTYIPSYREEHSEIITIPGTRIPGLRFLQINGMNTSKDFAKQRGEETSSMLGGVEIIIAYNATHGIISDGFEYICQKIGIPTNSESVTLKAIKNILNEAKVNKEDIAILTDAHSQGGQILYNAILKLNEEERGSIHARTFGSAKLIVKEQCATTTNYVSERDLIPQIANPYEYIKAKIFGSNNIIFLKSSHPQIDHSFEGAVYQNAYKKDINRFIRNYSK